MKYEDLIVEINRIRERPAKFTPRMVSYDEYVLLEEMWKEGKVDNFGYTKPEYLDEFYSRLNKRRRGY